MPVVFWGVFNLLRLSSFFYCCTLDRFCSVTREANSFSQLVSHSLSLHSLAPPLLGGWPQLARHPGRATPEGARCSCSSASWVEARGEGKVRETRWIWGQCTLFEINFLTYWPLVDKKKKKALGRGWANLIPAVKSMAVSILVLCRSKWAAGCWSQQWHDMYKSECWVQENK